MEFPHLLRLIEETQFDTIYHEHFSYLSLLAVERRLRARTGSTLFDVEELPTHGGSLRIYARHADDAREPGRGRASPSCASASARPALDDARDVRRRSTSACGRSSASCSSS